MRRGEGEEEKEKKKKEKEENIFRQTGFETRIIQAVA